MASSFTISFKQEREEMTITQKREYFSYVSSSLTLSELVGRAIVRYRQKHNRDANTVWFRPGEKPDRAIIAGLEVEVDTGMTKGHFGIGFDESS